MSRRRDDELVLWIEFAATSAHETDMSSSRQMLVIESEKSAKVQMKIKLEEVMLEKDRRRLGRSERTLLNRITVDQKILHRRFLQKKTRAELRYAKIKSDHALQQELRGEHTVALNSDVSRTLGGVNTNEGDSEILERVWAIGRQKMARLSGRRVEDEVGDDEARMSRSSSRSSRSKSSAMTDPDRVHKPRSLSAMERQPSSRPVTSKQRPATSSHKTRRMDDSPARTVAPPNTPDPSQRRRLSVKPLIGLSELGIGDSDAEGEGAGEEHDVISASTKHALKLAKSVTIDTKFDAEPHSTKPPQSGKSGKSSRPTTAAASAGVLLPEDIIKRKTQLKEDILRQLRAASAKCDMRIHDFLDTIESLSLGGDGSDYYSVKQDAMKREIPEWRIPGTPQELAQRRLGHVSVRSLTQRTLDTNFDRRISTYIDLSVI